ncbi:tetratricopeptide repeat protein [Actinokineospora soli]|uniref:Tetratricopeptide repeat protein n=1 Tax=Actinokineospora soli TaxID=1048753 RepID=A0ABW2TI99_9PSEU
MAQPIDAVLADAARLTAAGRPQAAIDVLRPVIAEHPDHAGAWCGLAAAFLDVGEPQRCLDAAKRAITLGEPAWAHRLASLALTELGRHDEAAISARESARRSPGDWRGYVTLAEALAPIAPADALTAARRAVSIAPEEPRTHEVLGATAEKAGETGAARAAYQEALRLDPGNAEVRAALAKLGKGNGARFGDVPWERVTAWQEAVPEEPDWTLVDADPAPAREAQPERDWTLVDVEPDRGPERPRRKRPAPARCRSPRSPSPRRSSPSRSPTSRRGGGCGSAGRSGSACGWRCARRGLAGHRRVRADDRGHADADPAAGVVLRRAGADRPGAGRDRGVQAARRPARHPGFLWARDKLMSVGAGLLGLGALLLAVWTAALALGAGGLSLLTPVVLLGLLAFGVGSLGMWRIRHRR